MGSLAKRIKRRNQPDKKELKKEYDRGVYNAVASMRDGTMAMLDQAYDKGFQEATIKAHMYMSILAVEVLHDKFGFGEKRAKRFAEELERLTGAVNSGHIAIDKIMRMLVDDGLKFMSKVQVEGDNGKVYEALAAETLEETA